VPIRNSWSHVVRPLKGYSVVTFRAERFGVKPSLEFPGFPLSPTRGITQFPRPNLSEAVGRSGAKELLPEKLQKRESTNDQRKLTESICEGPFRF
jgi:hypothetical protein